ncbi:MAG: hypothetical protein ABSD47_12275 [Candidatus Methylomirabilota bacterium]
MKMGPCPLCGTPRPVPARPLTALAAPPERGRRGLDEARRAEGWSWWGRAQ